MVDHNGVARPPAKRTGNCWPADDLSRINATATHHECINQRLNKGHAQTIPLLEAPRCRPMSAQVYIVYECCLIRATAMNQKSAVKITNICYDFIRNNKDQLITGLVAPCSGVAIVHLVPKFTIANSTMAALLHDIRRSTNWFKIGRIFGNLDEEKGNLFVYDNAESVIANMWVPPSIRKAIAYKCKDTARCTEETRELFSEAMTPGEATNHYRGTLNQEMLEPREPHYSFQPVQSTASYVCQSQVPPGHSPVTLPRNATQRSDRTMSQRDCCGGHYSDLDRTEVFEISSSTSEHIPIREDDDPVTDSYDHAAGRTDFLKEYEDACERIKKEEDGWPHKTQ